MSNEEIAQEWVQGLSVIKSHIAKVQDDREWQTNPGAVLAATDRIHDLKEWCLSVMTAWPAMREKFLEDIERRRDVPNESRTCLG